MKKIKLTHSQSEQVIDLREKGNSWLKIEKQTGIARRIAKREYDEWAARQSQQQLGEVRKEVAAQEYQLHLTLLSRMAESLLDSLTIPDPLTDLRKSDEVISRFLGRDFYQDQAAFSSQSGDRQKERRILRMNELLFKAIHDHTQKQVSWDILDTWRESRDKCIEDIEEMEKTVDVILTNILKQKEQVKIQDTLIKLHSHTLKTIGKGILLNVYLNNVMGQSSEITAMKGASLITKGTSWVVFHKDAPEEIKVTFDHEDPGGNELLAKEVTRISKWVVNNVTQDKVTLIERLRNEVKTMKDSADKLEAALNPLVLRPIILNTRCDICPV